MDDPNTVFASHPYTKRLCFEYQLLKEHSGIHVALLSDQGIPGFRITTPVTTMELHIQDGYPFLHELCFVNGGTHPYAPARHIVDTVIDELKRIELVDTIKRMD